MTTQTINLQDDLTALKLSARVRNLLTAAGIATVGHVAQLTDVELYEVPNFGPTAFAEVTRALIAAGLRDARREAPVPLHMRPGRPINKPRRLFDAVDANAVWRVLREHARPALGDEKIDLVRHVLLNAEGYLS